MGLDLPDFMLRVERSFGVKLDQLDINVLVEGRTKNELTAGDLHSWIVDICHVQNVRVPYSSWNRVRQVLATVVGTSPLRIHRNTLIVRELGFS